MPWSTGEKVVAGVLVVGAGAVAVAALAAGQSPPPGGKVPVLSLDGQDSTDQIAPGATAAVLVTNLHKNHAVEVRMVGTSGATGGTVLLKGTSDANGNFSGNTIAITVPKGKTHYVYARSAKVDSNEIAITSTTSKAEPDVFG